MIVKICKDEKILDLLVEWLYNQCMNTNKQPREIRSEFTANGMMAIAPVRAATQQNGWTIGKDFFKPVVKKQRAKNKSFLSRFL
jgi:hypothetical protein